jgi:hypothetical protein
MLHRGQHQLQDILLSTEPVAAPRYAPPEGEARSVRAHLREILRKIPSRKLERSQQHS